MKECYQVQTNPQALVENMICGEHYRITLLTDRLVRLEYAPDNRFVDAATQRVWNRDFPNVAYTMTRKADEVFIRTARMEIQYDEKPFSPEGLCITLYGGKAGKWYYGDALHDLHGTARTLDAVNGDQVELDHGIVSRQGFSVMDDSASLLLRADGWIEPRTAGKQDLYFFGYGHDYRDALRDFYHLCGHTPMLPRFALGNWWSRYYKYTQQSYLALMDRFAQEGIPLSVAVIDMDWHLVDIDPKYGNGWTGFTWNRALFPDHRVFLQELHNRGMRTTLNLHPADGIRAYEEAYPRMARCMGVDAAKEEPVRFEPTNPEFLQHYYEDVLHPMEEEGVDFWWMDWQQGTHTKIPGLDPLWVLNHFDFLDSQRKKKRGITFSRYAGPGSHRYPIGFSGDTIVTWESLQFQPYFTATASNVGYGWWSHDIGGHTKGYKNDELMARWTQYGVFSPILRLHSTCSEFNGKEPWRYKPEAAQAMKKALMLRHRLIPYLYTMNRRCFEQDMPLVLPLYYCHSEEDWAYNHPNEYYFGTELLVLPVTSPRLPGLNLARENLHLPAGMWYDVFSHRCYLGGREIAVYRGLDEIPVFAKAGAIVPLTDEMDCTKNPAQLHICAYLGDCGTFTLYEDDGETMAYADGHYAATRIILGSDALTIEPVEGACELIPEKRDYVIDLVGCAVEHVTVSAGKAANVMKLSGAPALRVEVKNVPVNTALTICFGDGACRPQNPAQEEVFALLDQAEIAFVVKDRVFAAVQACNSPTLLLSELQAMKLDAELLGAITEIVTAY